MSGKTAAERMKKCRERKKLRGMRAISLYLDQDTKLQLDRVAAKAGGHEAAIRQLLDLARATNT